MRKNNWTALPFRRRRGFTLVELAVVLAIIAVLVGGIMYAAGSTSQAQKANDAVTELANIQQVVRSTYNGQSTFNGLTSADVANSQQVPRKWVIGVPPAATALSSPFSAPVTVASSGTTPADATFTVTMYNVPDSACKKIVGMDFGSGLVGVTVNTSPTVAQRAMTPAESLACTGNSNKIAWEFI